MGFEMYAKQLTEDLHGSHADPDVSFDVYYNLVVDRLMDISTARDNSKSAHRNIALAIADLYMLAQVEGEGIDKEIRDVFKFISDLNKAVRARGAAGEAEIS